MFYYSNRHVRMSKNDWYQTTTKHIRDEILHNSWDILSLSNKEDSWYGLNQREMMLHCNIVSHWLIHYLECSLSTIEKLMHWVLVMLIKTIPSLGSQEAAWDLLDIELYWFTSCQEYFVWGIPTWKQWLVIEMYYIWWSSSQTKGGGYRQPIY